ncbi:hypothetical protein JCM19992_25650 [Thermostilla marina]
MANLTERCRELATAAMKDGIADAAIEVLKQHGYDGLTMDRVAEAAGVAKGSIYNYFSGKQDLVTHIFDRIIEPAMTRGDRIAGSEQSALEKLKATLRMWFDLFAEHRGLFDFLFRQSEVREICFSARRKRDRRTIDRIAGILRQGIEEGVVRALDAETAAELLIGATNFLIERQLDTGVRRDGEECVQHILDTFLRGFLTDSARSQWSSSHVREATNGD